MDYDQRTQENVILQFEGKNWNPDVDDENVNYDYLRGADLDFNAPETLEQLGNWSHCFVKTTVLDWMP